MPLGDAWQFISFRPLSLVESLGSKAQDDKEYATTFQGSLNVVVPDLLLHIL